MKLSIIFLLVLGFLQVARAEVLGSYSCDFKNDFMEDMILKFDLDLNTIEQIPAEKNPSHPANWTTIYSSSKGIYCGFKPTDSTQIKCPVDTQVNDNGFISKNLLCEREFSNGSSSALTQGTLYFYSTSNPPKGTFRCFFRGHLEYRANFSNCRKN